MFVTVIMNSDERGVFKCVKMVRRKKKIKLSEQKERNKYDTKNMYVYFLKSWAVIHSF